MNETERLIFQVGHLRRLVILLMAVVIRLAFSKSKEAQELLIERLAASAAPLTAIDGESISREIPELAHVPRQIKERRRIQKEFEEEQRWFREIFEKIVIGARKPGKVLPVSPSPATPAKKEEEQPPL